MSMIECVKYRKAYLLNKKAFLVFVRERDKKNFLNFSGCECKDISFRGKDQYVMRCIVPDVSTASL